MKIRRSRMTGDFLQIPNATVRDDRLSHMARGILAELLSRPDGWNATADDMWRASAAKHGKASPGRRVFRAAFAELKEHGYLTSGREALPSGQHATVLMLSDVPHGGMPAPPAKSRVSAGDTDVPHAGTSVRPGKTGETAGGADVPHGGTSGRPAETHEAPGRSDVPDGGTSDSPAETSNVPGGADVPPTGTPVPPAQTGIRAGRTDVPHAGTSKEENGKTNTGWKTTSAAAVASPFEISREDKLEFGNFWALYPKSKDYDKTLEEWTAAVSSGEDPKEITAAAVAYAKEKAGEPWRFIKHSANWLHERRYKDAYEPDPQPNGQASPQSRSSGGHHSWRNPENHDDYYGEIKA